MIITLLISLLISLGIISSEADYDNLSHSEKEYYEEMLIDKDGEIIIDDDLAVL